MSPETEQTTNENAVNENASQENQKGRRPPCNFHSGHIRSTHFAERRSASFYDCLCVKAVTPTLANYKTFNGLRSRALIEMMRGTFIRFKNVKRHGNMVNEVFPTRPISILIVFESDDLAQD